MGNAHLQRIWGRKEVEESGVWENIDGITGDESDGVHYKHAHSVWNSIWRHGAADDSIQRSR